MIGEMLGSYRILDKIGEGGMGEVYRARDTDLERDVAIKVLPETWAGDPDRLARFKREAQLLASLNHPHIAQIYGVETAAARPGAAPSTTALIMELVEGPTLADRIAAGPLPVPDTIAIARQIADALDAAHEHGIVHRDLKPANVKVREDGTVKLLDFGLAKAIAPADGAGSGVSLPTITSPAMTAMGIIMGTAAYMSPEQARGRAVDKRTDIWAFGCVLFEMLSRRRPFDGEDVTEVLAAVVKSEPAWEHLPASVPPRLVELLERCLEKDVRLRLRDIGDATFNLSEEVVRSVSRAGASAPPRRERLVWLAAVLVCATAAAVAWWPRSAPAGRDTVTRFSFVAPEGQRSISGLRHLAVSPDGTVIVYATSTRLYRRPLNQMESQLIPGTENATTLPMFSPDGRSIAYVSLDAVRMNLVLYTVPASGGTPVRLAVLGDVSNRAAWTPLDVSTAWNGDDILVSSAAGINAVSATSGARRVLVPLDPAAEVGTAPQLVDHGRQVLFTLRRVNETGPESSSVVVQTVGGSERRVLVRAATQGVAIAGHLVYLRGADLMAAAFDARRLEVTGEPAVIATGVAAGQWAISDAGTIAYQASGSVPPRDLVWVDRQGKEESLPIPPQTPGLLRLSPDGRRLALTGDSEIRVWSFEKRTITRMAEPGGGHFDAVWRTDSRRLLFSAGTSRTVVRILEKTVDGAGTATVVTEAPEGGFPNAISPDDRFLIFHRGAGELMIQSLDPAGPPRELTKGVALNAVFSPDGRWIAYQSDETGRAEIVVRAFPNTEARRWQVSSGGGKYPLWSPDGRELFFIDGAGALTSVGVESRNGFATGTPVELFQTRAYLVVAYSRPFDISRDGKRFLFMKNAGGVGAIINVVTGQLSRH